MAPSARAPRLLVGQAVVIRLGPRLLSPITVGLAVTRLGVHGYATVVVALAVAGILSQLTELGMNQLTIRDINRGIPARSVLYAALRLKVILIALIAVTLATVLLLSGASADRSVTIGLALLGVWATTLGSSPDAALIAIGAVKQSNLNNAVYGIAAAVFPLLSLMIPHPTARVFLAAVLASSLLYSPLGLYMLARQPSWRAPAEAAISVRAFARDTRWFAAASLAEPLYSRLDALILAAVAGSAQVTVYAVAYTLLNLLWTASDLIGTLHIGRLARRDQPLLHDRSIAKIGLAAALVLVGLAGPIAMILLPRELRTSAYETGLILAVAASLVLPNRLFLIAHRTRGHERSSAMYVAIALAINASANLTLDPTFGARGAAVGMVLAEFALLAIGCRVNAFALGELSLAPVVTAIVAGCCCVVGLSWGTSALVVAVGLTVAFSCRRDLLELLRDSTSASEAGAAA